MMEELIKQLEAKAARNGGAGAYAWQARELCGKAAAALTLMQRELARLADDPDRCAETLKGQCFRAHAALAALASMTPATGDAP